MSLPVYLISGLLGSGKTTCLRQLIAQKPPEEHWAVLINEFGEIDIDYAGLNNEQNRQLQLFNVKGGCICCSAQFTLSQTLQKLLQNHSFDRLFIEPTGLGHPAKILDTLNHFSELSIQHNLCVITPQQLTESRWQKSQVMRDLVNLADTILLNKTDLSSTAEIQASKTLINRLYQQKQLTESEYAHIKLEALNNHQKPALLFQFQQTNQAFQMQPTSHHCHTLPWHSKLEGVSEAWQQFSPENDAVLAIGWQLEAKMLFNRIKLKQWLETYSSRLIRAKGLIRMGKEWQLLNFADQQIQFEEIAWRQDSRLECLFDSSHKISPESLQKMEDDLQVIISKR